MSWVKSSITHKQINKGPTNPRNSSLECRCSGVAPEPALVLLMTVGTCRSGEQGTRGVSCAWWACKSAHDVATRSTSLPEGTTQQGCKSCNAVSLIMQKCRQSDEVGTETGFFQHEYLYPFKKSQYSLKLWGLWSDRFVRWFGILHFLVLSLGRTAPTD